MYEHELEELVEYEHKEYELKVDKDEEIQEFELEGKDLEQQECFEELEDLEHELGEELQNRKKMNNSYKLTQKKKMMLTMMTMSYKSNKSIMKLLKS